MNSTEKRVREAFDKTKYQSSALGYEVFKAGYLALLNKLEPVAIGNDHSVFIIHSNLTELVAAYGSPLYRLPEGVNRDQ